MTFFMHNLRGASFLRCPVCDAKPGKECRQATRHQDDPRDQDPAEALAYAEAEAFRALHHLKSLDPTHVLVTTVEAVLRYRRDDKLPSLLQRQAE